MKWVALGILLVVIIGGGIWIFSPGKDVLSSQDKTKALQTLLGRDVHVDAQNPQEVAWTMHTNQSVQFSYPSDAKIYTQDNSAAMKNKDMVDSFSFSNLTDHVTAVVQVVKFTGALIEYPAVNFRISQSTLYTATTSGTQTIQFMKKDDTAEKSFFLKKNATIISIAVTGYSMQKVDNLYSRIISSLKAF